MSINAKYAKYIEYINKTGQIPLAVKSFDEDWEPIGPIIRENLLAQGYIYMGGAKLPFPCPDGIYLRPDLKRTQVNE